MEQGCLQRGWMVVFVLHIFVLGVGGGCGFELPVGGFESLWAAGRRAGIWRMRGATVDGGIYGRMPLSGYWTKVWFVVGWEGQKALC